MLACGSLALVLVTVAQGQSANPSPAALREELQRTQAAHERLLVTRMRYDLGLPVHAGPYFATAEAERARGRVPLEQQLAEEQARVTALGERLVGAEEKLAHLRQDVSQAVADAAPVDAGGPVMTPPTKVQPASEPFSLHDEAPPAAPAEEPLPPTVVNGSGPAPVLVRGSNDHSRVGRALFLAKKFDRAREELTAAVAAKPDLVDLFYLARSCEALSDTNKADELYLQVESLDTVEVKGLKQPGTWARAARVARRQMQWMANNAQWQPERAIDSVPWRIN